LLFVNIPKNASASMKQIMRGCDFAEDNYFNLDRTGYYVFTVVRNPLDRFVSAYLEVIKRGSRDTLEYQFYMDKEQDPIGALRQFVRLMETCTYDEHVVPQVAYLDGMKVDLYLDFAFLSEDLEKLRPLLKTERVLERRNTTLQDKKRPIKTLLLTSGLWDEIKHIYADDIALYERVQKERMET